MASDPLYTVRTDDFDATFMLGAEDRVDTVDDVDIMVTLPDGTRWSATVMTMEKISGAMTRWHTTGEYLGGRYFRCPDLVIIQGVGVPFIMEILKEIVSTGHPEDLLVKVDPA